MFNMLGKYTLISPAMIFSNALLRVKALQNIARTRVEIRVVWSVSAGDSIFPPALDEASRCPA
jgi:hypothetical protein